MPSTHAHAVSSSSLIGHSALTNQLLRLDSASWNRNRILGPSVAFPALEESAPQAKRSSEVRERRSDFPILYPGTRGIPLPECRVLPAAPQGLLRPPSLTQRNLSCGGRRGWRSPPGVNCRALNAPSRPARLQQPPRPRGEVRGRRQRPQQSSWRERGCSAAAGRSMTAIGVQAQRPLGQRQPRRSFFESFIRTLIVTCVALTVVLSSVSICDGHWLLAEDHVFGLWHFCITTNLSAPICFRDLGQAHCAWVGRGHGPGAQRGRLGRGGRHFWPGAPHGVPGVRGQTITAQVGPGFHPPPGLFRLLLRGAPGFCDPPQEPSHYSSASP
ncbi:hypothetical protein H8959_005073 [Pygathrix nigripes]